MKTKDTIIKKLIELLEVENVNTSFNNGKITYDGNSYQIPISDGNKGSRKTNLKYR